MIYLLFILHQTRTEKKTEIQNYYRTEAKRQYMILSKWRGTYLEKRIIDHLSHLDPHVLREIIRDSLRLGGCRTYIKPKRHTDGWAFNRSGDKFLIKCCFTHHTNPNEELDALAQRIVKIKAHGGIYIYLGWMIPTQYKGIEIYSGENLVRLILYGENRLHHNKSGRAFGVHSINSISLS